jgi:hypothetical protein
MTLFAQWGDWEIDVKFYVSTHEPVRGDVAFVSIVNDRSFQNCTLQ